MPGLIIAPRARIFHGHEWVYATEVKKTFGDPQPGDVITLKDFRDRPLGTAIYNPTSGEMETDLEGDGDGSFSYTHLTLPTIYSV